MKNVVRGPDGLFMSLSYLLICILPCSVVSWPLIWPYLAIWTATGGVRLWQRDQKLLQDCLCFGAVTAVLFREQVADILSKRWDVLEQLGVERLGLWSVISAFLPLALVFGFGHRQHGTSDTHKDPTIPTSSIGQGGVDPPKALLFPCRTTHARIFPQKHAFGYSYLLCGFPIAPSGAAADGEYVSNGRDRYLGSWWLGIRAEDYLERGEGHLGFYGKLRFFLRGQGIKDAEWSYAYLVTAPRFFGYSFNPVSFWYIYDREQQLRRMVLEVNNTFGERRMYLLDGSSPSSPPRTPGTPGSELSTTSDYMKTKFSDIWMKDFHVSPFNSRKGSYALKALNPFPTSSYPDPAIDNTITLKSSKDYAKIVARVYNTGKPINPSQLGVMATLRFIVGWWWVGMMTSPRILREAFKLYFRQKLHVWFRPEVLPSSIGRIPTTAEAALQVIFVDYLNHLVQQASAPFSVKLHTAIPDRPKQTIATTHPPDRDVSYRNLEIRILTPVFYSRLVHYAHIWEAIDRECIFTDEKNRTLWISHPELLPLLLPNPKVPHCDADSKLLKRNRLEESRWTLLRKLRCPPTELAYPVTPKSAEFEVDDIRAMPFSELDRFVRGPGGQAYTGSYRRTVTKLFLAQRYAFGFLQLIELVDFLVRLSLCWLGVRMLRSNILYDPVARPAVIDQVHKPEETAQAWRWLFITAFCFSGCHIYGLLKGYR